MSSLISQMLKDISIDNPYIDEFKTTENKMVVRAKHIDYNPSKLRISTMTPSRKRDGWVGEKQSSKAAGFLRSRRAHAGTAHGASEAS